MSKKTRSKAYQHFLVRDGDYVCNIEVSSGGVCGAKISGRGKPLGPNTPTPCSNLKRHLERHHLLIYGQVVKEDKEMATSASSISAPAKTMCTQMKLSVSGFVMSSTVKIQMTKNEFEKGLVEMVAYEGTPLTFFSGDGFKRINGNIASQPKVNLSRDNVRRLVLNAAAVAKDRIRNSVTNKLVFVKLDACTRLRVNYLGISVQFFHNGKVNVRTLGVRETKNEHSSMAICKILTDVLKEFGIHHKQILACIVDNASSMTKTVERLNEMSQEIESESPAESEGEEDEDESEGEETDVDLDVSGMEEQAKIHHMRCAVHTLQLAIRDGLKGEHPSRLLAKIRAVVTTLRTPRVDEIVRQKSGKKGAIIDQATRWGSTYLMIERLLTLKPVVLDLGMEDVYLSPHQWQEIDGLKALLEEAYKTTIRLQSDSLIPGQFFREWKSLVHYLEKRGGMIAEEIVRSMKQREVQLLDNDVLLAGIFIDARYRILLTEEQCGRARQGLREIYTRMTKVEDSTQPEASAASGPSSFTTSGPSSSSSKKDQADSDSNDSDFDIELDKMEKAKEHVQPQVVNEFEDSLKKVEELGRLKGSNVWEVIAKLPCLRE